MSKLKREISKEKILAALSSITDSDEKQDVVSSGIISSVVVRNDSVGFAIEDFSTLKLVYHLAKKMQKGNDIELIPSINDPKNLYGLMLE